MKIDNTSIQYWDQCLYDAYGVFGIAKKTSEITVLDTEKLCQFSANAFTHRDSSTPGEEFYSELKAIAALMSGKKVLNFGCGNGIDSFYLARQGAIVSSVDIIQSNIKMTDALLKWHKHYAYLLKDYSDIQKLDNYDLILSNGCLHHIQEDKIQYVVSELMKHLNKGGLFLVMVYTHKLYPTPNSHPESPEGPYCRGYSANEFGALLGSEMKMIGNRLFSVGHFQWLLYQKEV